MAIEENTAVDEVVEEFTEAPEETEELSLRETLEQEIEKGEDEPKAEAVEEENPTETAEDAAGDEKTPEGDQKAENKGKKSLKAPASWKPKSRELWSKVPSELQEQIQERESHVEEVLRSTADARRTHDAISSLAQSYAPIMAAEGVSDPLQAVDGLFKTVAELRVGSPEQKAVRMAQMIKHYGIDINALDSALVGEQAVPSEHTQIESIINERLGPVNELLGQIKGQQQQSAIQVQQEATRQVESFDGEFLDDVRMDMADLIDMAASRGQSMTLQEAYDKAVLLNPDIQAVVNERKQAQNILGKKESAAGKRSAASSLASRASQPGVSDSPSTIRGSILASWDDAESNNA